VRPKPHRLVNRAVVGAEHHHRHADGPAVGADGAEHSKPVRVGHADVENDQLRQRVRSEEQQQLRPVRHRDGLSALQLEQADQRFARVRVIVRHQDHAAPLCPVCKRRGGALQGECERATVPHGLPPG